MTYRIDLHVHTARYSECAELMDPAALGDAALEKRLAGVVITEHDVVWSRYEIADLRQATGQLVMFYAGVEVTCREGHFVVIGLEDARDLSRNMPLNLLALTAHAQGAVVIWAHPGRDHALPTHRPELAAILASCDAVEHSAALFQEPLVSLNKNRGIPIVAGSDAHYAGRLGEVATIFPFLPASERQLALAIRMGMCSLSLDTPHSDSLRPARMEQK